MPQSNDFNAWKTRTMVVGTVLGALIGFGTSYLFSRTAEEKGGTPPSITAGDTVKAAVGVIGLMRGIAALGDNRRK